MCEKRRHILYFQDFAYGFGQKNHFLLKNIIDPKGIFGFYAYDTFCALIHCNGLDRNIDNLIRNILIIVTIDLFGCPFAKRGRGG